jgi:hypothetical protein
VTKTAKWMNEISSCTNKFIKFSVGKSCAYHYGDVGSIPGYFLMDLVVDEKLVFKIFFQ